MQHGPSGLSCTPYVYVSPYVYVFKIVSIAASSSSLSGPFASAAAFSLICSGRLAPMRAVVTAGSAAPTPAPSAPASGRAPARSRSACATFASLSSVMAAGLRKPVSVLARESAGMPPRYLFVRQPLRQRAERDHAHAAAAR